jgi:hypothetical protein
VKEKLPKAKDGFFMQDYHPEKLVPQYWGEGQTGNPYEEPDNREADKLIRPLTIVRFTYDSTSVYEPDTSACEDAVIGATGDTLTSMVCCDYTYNYDPETGELLGFTVKGTEVDLDEDGIIIAVGTSKIYSDYDPCNPT